MNTGNKLFTEKHLAFHAAVNEVARVDEAIASHEAAIENLRIERIIAEDIAASAGSDAAQEKLDAGLAGIEMPDNSLRLCEKSRRGRKTEDHPNGTPPKYSHRVSEKVLRA
jgi:hypothetical protein